MNFWGAKPTEQERNSKHIPGMEYFLRRKWEDYIVGTKEVKSLQEEFHISKVSRYNRLLAAHLHLSNPLTSPLLNPSSYFPEIRRTKSGSFVILIFLLDFSMEFKCFRDKPGLLPFALLTFRDVTLHSRVGRGFRKSGTLDSVLDAQLQILQKLRNLV